MKEFVTQEKQKDISTSGFNFSGKEYNEWKRIIDDVPCQKHKEESD